MPENNPQNLTRFEATTRIIGVSVPMIAAYTLSFTVVVVLFLLSLLSENEEESAGASLASVVMNLAMVLGVALLLAGGSRVSFFEGIIRSLTNAASEQEGDVESFEEAKEESPLLLENNNAIVVYEEGNINNEKVEIIGSGFSKEECRDLVCATLRHSLYLSVPLAIPMMGTFFFSEEILNAIGENKEATAFAGEFLKMYAFAVPGILARVSQEQTLFGLGHQKFVMAIAVTDFLLCSGLAVLLGFGGAGIPRLGPTGVALAYDLESYLTSFFYFLRLTLSKSLQEYAFFNFYKHVRGAREEFWTMLKRGGGILFTLFNQLALTVATTLFAGLLNDPDQASAWGAALALLSFFLIITTAFGQGCMIEVSREIGAKDYKAASRMGIYGLIASMFFVAPPLALVTFFPQSLSTLLRLDEAASSILTALIPIVSVGVFASNIFFNLIQQLRPLGQNWFATLLPFLMTLFGVPAALVFSKIAGDDGIGLAYTGVTILVALAVFAVWAKEIRPGQIQAKHEAKEKIQVENEAEIKVSNEPKPKQSSSWWPSNWCPGTFGKARPDQPLLPVSSFAPS